MPASLFPPVDFIAQAARVGVDLNAAFDALFELYRDVDNRNAQNTADLDLPCHAGCDSCCHEAVFITPLEFYASWDWLQKHWSEEHRLFAIEDSLYIFEQNREVMEALDRPEDLDGPSHDALAKKLKFRCPLLSRDGRCGVYPVRELLGRLFGSSFNRENGVYGCHVVGQHLAGKTVSLLRADVTARRLKSLPFTGRRHVYPYFVHRLYGAQL